MPFSETQQHGQGKDSPSSEGGQGVGIRTEEPWSGAPLDSHNPVRHCECERDGPTPTLICRWAGLIDGFLDWQEVMGKERM